MGNISKRLPTIILGFLIGTTSFAQNLDRREHRICDLRVPVNLVVVPVTVEGKEGNLIHDLQKSDFEVREDDLVQHLTYFSTEPSPLSVAILVDRTIDDRTQEIMKHNMLALVESFSSFDEMALYEFLSTTKKLQDFTFKKEELLNPITKIEFVPCRVQVLSPLAYAPWLNTSFLDNAIMTAAYDLQRRGKNRRKVIFAVSMVLPLRVKDKLIGIQGNISYRMGLSFMASVKAIHSSSEKLTR